VIDTHCHLLPGIDDGPESSGEALELAGALADAGIREIVCTPHFSRRFPTEHEVARKRLEIFTRALADAELPLRVGLAAEVGSAAAVEAPAADLRRRKLGDRYILIELEPDTPAGLVEVALTRVSEIGLTPVFAHPERCRAVRSQPRVLDSAHAAGALVQVVAPSLSGRWGEATAEAAWRLLESGRVDLLASDAHRARHAGERLTRVLELVSARIGRQALIELTETNPARVIKRS
jgi:protein-tyrosine phosphatase